MKKYIFNFLIFCLMSFGCASFVSCMQSEEQFFAGSFPGSSIVTSQGVATLQEVEFSEQPDSDFQKPNTNTVININTNTVINIFVFMFTVKHCSLSDLMESYGESIYLSWLKLRKMYRNYSIHLFNKQ